MLLLPLLQAQRAARANGYAVHAAGGTELLLDVASTAHEASGGLEPRAGAACLPALLAYVRACLLACMSACCVPRAATSRGGAAGAACVLTG